MQGANGWLRCTVCVQSLASLLWALSSMGHPPSHPFLDRVSEAVQRLELASTKVPDAFTTTRKLSSKAACFRRM